MTRDEALRTLAEIQHGLVARRQAARLGFDWAAVAARVRSGDWVEETDRVLRRRGAPATREQALMLGVLDGPVGAVLAGRAAAELWGLPGFRGERVEILQARQIFRHGTTAATVHRPKLLLPHHLTEVRGIPSVTIPRLLFDIAFELHERRLDRLIESVIGRSPGVLVGLRRLLDELACRGRPGITAMRAQLAKRPPGYVPVASGLELRFARLLEQAGEPAMSRQVDLGGHEWIGRVDFVDRLLKLIAEVDSIVHHTTPGDVARDEARDRALLAAGFAKVIRIPEEHIWYQPELAIRAVRMARRELRSARSGRKDAG